jgi:rubrerythrin
MNKNIQTEVDACYLYRKLADNETEETIASVFHQMSEIEKSHAEAFLQKQKIFVPAVHMFEK